MVILDTDVMIDLLRGHPSAVAWLESLGDAEVFLPGFVAMELIQGCRNKQEQRHLRKQISRYAVLWPKPEDCQTALSVFADLHLATGLGVLDALIGQTAVAFGYPLYTFNERHYSGIPGLSTIRPYERS